jgi:hypothetical protein
MATDFRSGRDFPRRGRDELGGFFWLARVADKGRADAAGTIFDYIYPCPMDRGMFERWGITAKQFDEALRSNPTDEEIVAWLRERVGDAQRERANRWLLEEKSGSLDRQDAEEGVIAA